MTRTQLFLLIEGLAFLFASSIHLGVISSGYGHRRAGTAEGIIGLVLLAGLLLTYLKPSSARTIGLAALGFALFGTLVGLFTIAVGVGPRTAPDLLFHAFLISSLPAALFITARAAG